jgi:hypothetical protein
LFLIEHAGSAFNTMSPKWKNVLQDEKANRWQTAKEFTNEKTVETVTLDSLIEKYGIPDYIKIDVEGHEWECLEGLNQNIRVISFEANLPEFRTETLQGIAHLKKINKLTKFNYCIDETEFYFPNHMDAPEFYDFIEHTELRYMEIFSFMPLR